MGCSEGCSKVCVVVASLVVMIVSVMLLIFVSYSYSSESLDAIQSATDITRAKTVLGVMVALLVFTILTSACGLLGVCLAQRCLLTIYGISLIVILIFHFVMFIVCVSVLSYLHVHMGYYLNQTMYEYNQQFANETKNNNYSSISVSWNVIQVMFEGCAVDNYTEWANVEYFQKKPKIRAKGGEILTQDYPVYCCEGIEDMVSLSQIAKNEVSKETITQHDGAKEFLDKCYKNNHKQVFSGGVKNQARVFLGVIIGLGASFDVILIGVQVFLVWATYIVYKNIG
ncbi:uncharacterized protein LOC142353166 [Convolutriloba macropyga]|uniref:uncharacterized protein LOC142353166 n=1 Tax=Convolutriloba macropyga TaxID=536237 RepID=UPI003F521244